MIIKEHSFLRVLFVCNKTGNKSTVKAVEVEKIVCQILRIHDILEERCVYTVSFY